MDSMATFLEWIGNLSIQAAFIFAWEYGRYLFGAGGVYLLVWVLLKPWMKSRKIRAKTPKARQQWAEVWASAQTAGVFTLVSFGIIAGLEAGVMEIYDDIDAYGWTWFFLSIPFIIIVHDAYFYWTHRLMHVRGVMKYMHWRHHRSHNPSPWAAYSFDVPEAAVHATFIPLFLTFFPMHGLAMFIWSSHMIIRNGMGHSGFELFPRSWAVHPFFGLLTTVTHHDMHHSNGNYNFGLYFSWWDRLMGTEHPDYLARVTGDGNARRNGARAVSGIKKNA